MNKKLIFSISELEHVKFPLDELFELQVNHNNVKYEFLIRFSSNNKNLICMGSGAFDPKKISPPIFSRFTWESEFEESIIYYNDPTLYLNNSSLRLGWGVGKNDQWYLLIIAEIIGILARKNDIKSENILFFGSSGGGFTSIILATLIKNSSAMVNNPQLFCKPWKEFFDNIIDVCFDNLDKKTVFEQYKYRFNVLEMFKREKYVPPITYLVNVNSRLDMEQLIPFINGLAFFKSFEYRINVLLYPKENGHNGILDKEETIKLIKNSFK